MTEIGDVTTTELFPVPVLRPGTRVLVRRFYGNRFATEVGLGSMGRIEGTPCLGAPLEIRIRGRRGFATSPVSEIRQLSPADIAIRTESSVYVVTDLTANDAIDEREIAHFLVEMTTNLKAAGEPAGETDYVRLEREGHAIEAGSKRVRVSVQRGGRWEDLGNAELLSEPELGAPVRFVDAGGAIRSTSDALEVRSLHSPRATEVRTRNSVYRFVLLGGEPFDQAP